MKKKKTLKIIFSVFIIWFSVISWIIFGNKIIGITKINITSDKIPKQFQGFRIAQISDYHNGTFEKSNEQLVKKLTKCNPDIIVITGDFFDGKDEDFSMCMDFIEKGIKIAPIYYVTGNHEACIKEYKDLKKQLESFGVTVLENKTVTIKKDDAKISLIGIQDLNFYKRKNSKTIQNKIQNLMNDDTYNILLSHRPELFEAYVSCGVDLVFTGHAHGGQFRIPFIGGIYAPHQGFFPKYDAGLYTKNNTNMIVNRGLGQSSIPYRLNNPPEIILVELETEDGNF